MITSNSWEGNLIVPFYAFVPFFFGEMSKSKHELFISINDIIDKETLRMLALESNVGSAWELYKKLSPGKPMTRNSILV